MLTPDVKKYIENQFESQLTSDEIISDLVKGGWRESDAQTVVRQYETMSTLEHASSKPSTDTKKDTRKKTQKIDFSKVGSHGDDPQIEVGEDFDPGQSSGAHKEPHSESVEEQKENREQERQAKAEKVLLAHVNKDTSYDDLAMSLPVKNEDQNIFRNNPEADAYQEPETTFSPLDVKPKHSQKEQKKSPADRTPAPPIKHVSSQKRGVFVALFLLWTVLIGVVVSLYIFFIQRDGLQTQPASQQEVRVAGQVDSEQGVSCDTNINCFIQEGSSCQSRVTVTKIRINSFFASEQIIKTLLQVRPGDEGKCLFEAQVLEADTQFTGDVAADTQRNIQELDEESIGLQGVCNIPQEEVGLFLEKVREGSLSDLDILSANCIGLLYDNKIEF